MQDCAAGACWVRAMVSHAIRVFPSNLSLSNLSLDCKPEDLPVKLKRAPQAMVIAVSAEPEGAVQRLQQCPLLVTP